MNNEKRFDFTTFIKMLDEEFAGSPIHCLRIGTHTMVLSNKKILDGVALIINQDENASRYKGFVMDDPVWLKDDSNRPSEMRVLEDLGTKLRDQYDQVISLLGDLLLARQRFQVTKSCVKCTKFTARVMDKDDIDDKIADVIDSCSISVSIISVFSWIFKYLIRVYSESDNARVDPRVMNLLTVIASNFDKLATMIEK